MFVRLALLLCLILTAVPARAQDGAIGKIVVLEGGATVKRFGAEGAQAVAVDTPLYMKDTVETEIGARLVAVFEDETELTLGENSLTTIDEYVFDPAAEGRNMTHVTVARGAFLYASGLIGKVSRPNVQITVPYGTIGLRGTTVWGGTLDMYSVFVLDGKVSVQTKRGAVTLAKGQGTDIAGMAERPTTPKEWGQPKIDRAVATIALKDGTAAQARVTAEKERLRALRGETLPVPAPAPAPEAPPLVPVPAPGETPQKKTDNGFGPDEGQEALDKAREDIKERRQDQIEKQNKNPPL